MDNAHQTDVIDNSNNGMITSAWGEPTWDASFYFAFGFPVNPTEEDKARYIIYYENLGYWLPCKFCRASYHEFLKTTNPISLDHFKSRHTLITWLHGMRESVNKKLGVDYGTTIADVYQKYEPARSSCTKVDKNAGGCVSPLYQKAVAYHNQYYKDAPIIPITTMNIMIDFAKMKKFPESDFKFHKTMQDYDNDIDSIKHLPIWKERRIICHDLIWKMRLDGLNNLETSGDFEGCPTDDELRLMLWMSTSLRKDEICKMLTKMTNSQFYFNFECSA